MDDKYNKSKCGSKTKDDSKSSSKSERQRPGTPLFGIQNEESSSSQNPLRANIFKDVIPVSLNTFEEKYQKDKYRFSSGSESSSGSDSTPHKYRKMSSGSAFGSYSSSKQPESSAFSSYSSSDAYSRDKEKKYLNFYSSDEYSRDKEKKGLNFYSSDSRDKSRKNN